MGGENDDLQLFKTGKARMYSTGILKNRDVTCPYQVFLTGPKSLVLQGKWVCLSFLGGERQSELKVMDEKLPCRRKSSAEMPDAPFKKSLDI